MTESLHALSGAYVVDALDDHERATFEQHLPGCRDCQDEVASLREAAAVLADASALTPPTHLRASVLAQISTVRPLPPLFPSQDEVHELASQENAARDAAAHDDADDAPLAPVVTLRPRRRMAALVAAAAAVVVVGAGTVYQPWHQDNPPVLSISAVDEVLTAPDAQKVSNSFSDGSRADVYRSPSKGQAAIVTHSMAAPPSGKVYELWLRNAAGRMNPAGLMTSAGDNKMLLTGNANGATAVGITVEPAGGSDQPTTTPIAMFELNKGTA